LQNFAGAATLHESGDATAREALRVERALEGDGARRAQRERAPPLACDEIVIERLPAVLAALDAR
jgi:hypothetical protein